MGCSRCLFRRRRVEVGRFCVDPDSCLSVGVLKFYVNELFCSCFRAAASSCFRCANRADLFVLLYQQFTSPFSRGIRSEFFYCEN